MTYSNYIKKDYKKETLTSKVRSHRTLLILLFCIILILISAWLMLNTNKKYSYYWLISNLSKIELFPIQQDLASENNTKPIKLGTKNIIEKNSAINDELNKNIERTPDLERLISSQGLSESIKLHSN